MTMEYFWIVLLSSICFGIQSVFGFGGYLLLVSTLSFLFDVKTAVSTAVFVSLWANILILRSDYTSCSWSIFFRIFLYMFPGILLGIFVFSRLDVLLFQRLFGGFVILYAFLFFFKPTMYIKESYKNIVNFCGGIIAGMFGSSSLFMLMTMKEKFNNKSQLRSTFVLNFIALGTLLVGSYFVSGQLKITQLRILPVLIPVLFLSVYIGHKIHRKISDKYFKIGVAILIFISGIKLLF